MKTGTRIEFILLVAVLLLAAPFMEVARGTPVTTIYEFVPDQSEVIKSGGFFGRRYTYSIEGQFQLIVDYDADAASFDQVNATTSEPVWYLDVESGYYTPTQSLNVLFHMTELKSTYVSDTQIDFLLEIECPLWEGGNEDIRIRATFMDDLLYLTGGFHEPGYDTYQFDLDAVAVPEPATFFLLGAGGLVMKKRRFGVYEKSRERI